MGRLLLLSMLALMSGSGASSDDVRIAAWVETIDRPDDCRTILDYDLAEWPDGLGAVLLCMDKFSDHYSRPAHPTCETWARILKEPGRRAEFAREFHYKERVLMDDALEGWRRDRCDESRRDELFRRAWHEKAKREAEWACEFDALDRSERRLRRGLPEIDTEQCWSFFGGDRWKRFYEGPETPR